jgi:hypothetical protein
MNPMSLYLILAPRANSNYLIKYSMWVNSVLIRVNPVPRKTFNRAYIDSDLIKCYKGADFVPQIMFP